MTEGASISWEDLHQLFSVILCIDGSMNIAYASSTPRKFMPELTGEPRLNDVFEVRRPGSLDNFDEALTSVHSLCLLTAKSGRFAIRGQLVRSHYAGRDMVCFCGAPWLFWINSHCPDIRLGLEDYSSQDVQLDQLFFMNTEKRMVADLEQMNEDLKAAKEKLEETNVAQRRFFAQMSHELRTPLNGVVSALSLMESSPAGPRQSQLMALAQSSSNNLMQVINYVLDVSRLELGGFEDEATVFNWSALMQSVVDVVRARAVEKSLEIHQDITHDVPTEILGHPQLLRQVLLNLLINAIKFTDVGSITLRCLPVSREDGALQLRFEIEDTGIGIAPELQERIFEPFWTAAPDKIGKEQSGTGLGLDIVRRNVEYMGGVVALRSEPGKGSSFWFELPLTAAEVAAAPDPAAGARIRSGAPLAGDILLVDDNETNLLLGSLILESLGARVTTAPGGAEALAAVRQSHFDLVLMDLTMPEIDGLEATRRMRTFSDRQTLPIVALTAHADTSEKKSCLEAGMNDYLTKPIDKDLMAEKLAQWLCADRAAAGQPEDLLATEPEPDVAPGQELADPAVLEDLVRQIGRDNLAIVIDKVRAEAALRWGELVAADKAADAAALQRHVHSLASIFRSVGLIRAGDALKEIEITLRGGERPASGWIEALEPLQSDSLRALEKQLARL